MFVMIFCALNMNITVYTLMLAKCASNACQTVHSMVLKMFLDCQPFIGGITFLASTAARCLKGASIIVIPSNV
jgi:hypothetical protein